MEYGRRAREESGEIRFFQFAAVFNYNLLQRRNCYRYIYNVSFPYFPFADAYVQKSELYCTRLVMRT